MKKEEFEKYKIVVEGLRKKYVPFAKVDYSKLMTVVHGKASPRDKRIVLSLYALEQGTWNDAMNTILHEIAHLLTPGQSHNNVWKNKYIELCKVEKIPIPPGKIMYANFRIDKSRSYKNILPPEEKIVETNTQYNHYWWVCVACKKKTAPRTTKPKNPPHMCYHCFRTLTKWYNSEEEWNKNMVSKEDLKKGTTIFYLGFR